MALGLLFSIQSQALSNQVVHPIYSAQAWSEEEFSSTDTNDWLSREQQSVFKELVLPEEVSNLARTALQEAARSAALQASAGSTALQDAANTPAMLDTSTIPRNTATLKITMHKRGFFAKQAIEKENGEVDSFLSDTYPDYYEVMFPSMTEFESVKPAGNNSTGPLLSDHTIENFWEYSDKVGEHRWLYADNVIAQLELPEKIENRKHAFELNHPVIIVETWVVPISNSVRMHFQETSIESDWVSFTKTATIDEEAQQATLVFKYTTLSSHVAASDIETYVFQVNDINDNAAFYLQKSLTQAAAMPVAHSNAARIILWSVFLGMFSFTLWWCYHMRKYRKPVKIHAECHSRR